MKAIVILILLALVVSAAMWRMRKSQAEADRARRKSQERRKKQQEKAVTPELDMTWPVIIRPASGAHSQENPSATEELAMTEIEFESSEPPVPQRGVAN